MSPRVGQQCGPGTGCSEEYKKIGIEYLYLRARAENDWYPHYIHNLATYPLRRLIPARPLHADIRRTRLLG